MTGTAAEILLSFLFGFLALLDSPVERSAFLFPGTDLVTGIVERFHHALTEVADRHGRRRLRAGTELFSAQCRRARIDLRAFTLYVVGDPSSLNALAQGSLRQHLADRVVYTARIANRRGAA